MAASALSRYLARDAALVAALGPPAADDADLAARARAFAATPPPEGWPRDRLAALLAEDAPPAVAAEAARLRDPGSVVVVAGQQPAVGGGPLYTLTKAMHAAAIAARLRAAGVAATALFWCASEDHDLGEANHADLLAHDGRIVRVHGSLDAPAVGRRAALRWRAADRWWTSFAATATAVLGDAADPDLLLPLVPARGEPLGAWQCRVVRSLVGIPAVEGHRLRPLWGDALRRVRAAWPAAGIAHARSTLAASDAADPLGPLEAPPLFVDRRDGREALAPGADAPLEDLSPGAALRPILQQAAMPAAIVVLGPGELSYHAVLGPVYAAAAVPRPTHVPRASLLLLSAEVRAGLMAHGVTPGSLPARHADDGHDAALGGLDAALAELEVRAARTAGEDAVRLRAGLARLGRERDRLARSLARGRRRSMGLPALGHLRDWCFPRGLPQDRVMCGFQPCWRWGRDAVERMRTAMARVEPGAVVEVDLP